MSDIGDYNGRSRVPARHGQDDDDDSEDYGSYGEDRRRNNDDEGEGDSLDDDDDDEDEDEDDNGEDLRRDGFVVDDDDVEDGVASDSEERRKRRKKKKRRHHHTDRAADHDDNDALDEDDLALVAENTYQGPSQALSASNGAKFKRLKRGRVEKSGGGDDEDEDDLRAELDDLIDNGEGDRGRGAGGYTDRLPGDDNDARRGYGRRSAHDDDLGLFGNDNDTDMDEDDFRASRRRGRMQQDYASDSAMDAEMADETDDGDLGGVAASRRGRGPPARELGGALGNMADIVENMDAIDEDMWMELQDIFGDGEEYAFAMEGPQADEDAYKEKTLADVFEPAELEAKMMTQ
ncbi:Transcription elongation factor spt6, partial [Coemansia erecta]